MSCKTLRKWVLVITCACATAGTSQSAQVIYVDDDAPAGGSGVSWADACTHLQDALTIAAAAIKPVEIRVAEGVYRPDQGAGIVLGDRNATFQLLSGVGIKGGHAGRDAPDPNACDPKEYETVLSGDLKGDDVDVQEANGLLSLGSELTHADNSMHVVTGSGTDETAVLEGVVVAAGYGSPAVGPTPFPLFLGGAMLNYSGSPTVLRCVLRDNFAYRDGGAVYNNNSRALFSDCFFGRNACGSEGGAVCNENSSPVFTGCTFEENSGGDRGGAIANDMRSVPLLKDCTFRNNTSRGGGALYHSMESTADVENCLFEHNLATSPAGSAVSGGRGGAIFSQTGLTLTQCTFRENSATTGGAIYTPGTGFVSTHVLRVSDCLFSANTVDRTSDTTASGGAIYMGFVVAELEECVFENNRAPNGGAVCARQGYAKLVGCRFAGNSATMPILGNSPCAGGGAILADACIMRLTGCDFQGNLALGDGGAVLGECTDHATKLALVNCLFAGNRAESGSGLCMADTTNGSSRLDNCTFASNLAANGSALTGLGALEHCIVWDGDGLVSDVGSMATAVYCDVQGGYPGQGNIDVDPLFVRPGYWADAKDPNLAGSPDDPNAVWVAGDYHLQSQAGHWDADGQTWIVDAATSLCIDAGDMGTPMYDEPFPNGGILNLGAYGGTAQASKSYFGELVCEVPIDGDINGDCKVDSLDAQLAMQDWRVSGTSASNQPPTIVITQPVEGAVVEVSESDSTVLIVVDVSDADGSVAQVMFSLAQTTDDASWRCTYVDRRAWDGWQWRCPDVKKAGSYTIIAYAVDDDCEIAYASQVRFTLNVVK